MSGKRVTAAVVQAAPVGFDAGKTIDKLGELTAQAAARGAQEIAVDVVDAERQVEGDAADAALELFDHPRTVDHLPEAVRSRTASGCRLS